MTPTQREVLRKIAEAGEYTPAGVVEKRAVDALYEDGRVRFIAERTVRLTEFGAAEKGWKG